MQRFNYEEPEEYGDDFYFPDDFQDEDMEKYLYDRNIDLAQLEIANTQQNQTLLFKVIKMLEKEWFWRFRSISYRTKQIVETFLTMKNLLKVCDTDTEEESEEEPKLDEGQNSSEPEEEPKKEEES